jgi:putative tryptophan/tyrosine transport system substrate-binding protein
MQVGTGMRRREFIALFGGAAAAWPLAARAQQAGQVRRIGMLMGVAENDPARDSLASAFTQSLQDLGWRDGGNIRIDYRWSAGDSDRIKSFAAELVALQPDVIVGQTTPVVAALKQQTKTIPIVFIQVSDPVGSGFIADFAAPGGNITGFTNLESSMSSKLLELLKEVAPGIARVGLMFNPQTAPGGGSYFLKSAQTAASGLNVTIVPAPIHDAAEIDTVMAALAREPGAGLVVTPDVFVLAHREQIVALAAHNRMPAVYAYRFFAVSGGLMSYGTDLADLFRRAAPYVDRILKGAKPAELPVQQPTKFELVINLKTAKTLGLSIPQTLLATADEVIE